MGPCVCMCILQETTRKWFSLLDEGSSEKSFVVLFYWREGGEGESSLFLMNWKSDE